MRLALSLALAVPLVATAAIAVARPAIAIGEKVPANFAAVDTTGKARDFKSITGKKGVVLVFFRSAAWCPFCQVQLKDLRGLPAELGKRGYTLAAISYDKPETLGQFAAKQQIGYTLLSDAGSKMIDAFGLRDPAYAPDSFAYGVPRATVLVIAPNGTVKRKLTTEDYKIRPSNQAILSAVDAG